MKFRPHRELLADAMAEVVEFNSVAAFLDHLNRDLANWFIELTASDVRVEPYRYDSRIGWNTYIVTIRNKKQNHDRGTWYFGEEFGPDYFGAVGFTDGPLPPNL